MFGLPSPADTYTFVAGLYTLADDGTPNQLEQGDGLTFTALGDVTFHAPAWAAPTTHPLDVTFSDGTTLYGVDHEGESVYAHLRLADGSYRSLFAPANAISAEIAMLIRGASDWDRGVFRCRHASQSQTPYPANAMPHWAVKWC